MKNNTNILLGLPLKATDFMWEIVGVKWVDMISVILITKRSILILQLPVK
jgi:hypothetical protein